MKAHRTLNTAVSVRLGERARWVALAVAVGLGACSSGADKPKPAPLEPIAAPIAGKVVWSQRIGAVQFPLQVAVAAGSFTAASTDGTVVSLQADTGRELWRAAVGTPLSAGVGSDGRFAAVVTRGGDLVVLEAGRLVWRKPIGVRVNTAPLVAGERVFVLGSDRSVLAFDALDGKALWTTKRPSDPLTLSQGSVIAAFKNTLLVGQGQRLAGLDPTNGAVRWEVPVATPRGTNEIERLADLIGPVARVGDVVCARSFQAAVGCVNAERGSVVWSKNVGGLQAVAADGSLVAAADASDRITAWKAANGDIAWTNEKLLYRGLSGPALIGTTLVFGDATGTVHFLSRDNGNAQLRLSTDGSAVVGTPALSGTTLLVATRNGGLFAMRPE